MNKEYEYKEEEVIIDGYKYIGIFPEIHSRIKGLVVLTVDLNADDDYANITDWHTISFVLYKKSKNWKKVYQGRPSNFNINGKFPSSMGFYDVLFMLETNKVRKQLEKEHEICYLKNVIKKDIKRLKQLGVEYNE